MGAALLQHALIGQPAPLNTLKVISAGVSSREGLPATDHAVTVLKKVGIKLTGHSSRAVTQELLDRSFVVLCMTESHRDMIQLTADPVPKHLYLFREFMPGTIDRQIPDPYGGPLSMYEAARDEMVEAIPSLVDHIRSLCPAQT